MKSLSLLFLCLTGCTGTNAALRPKAEAARTLEDVNDAIGAHAARVFLVGKRAPAEAAGLRLTPTHLELHPLFGASSRVAIGSVERIEVDVRRGGTTLWMIGLGAVGANLGGVLARVACRGGSIADGIWCSSLTGGVGFALGMGIGRSVGRRQARRDPPVVVYQGPPDRYGVR